MSAMIDVRCPQCATIFELDERQMRGGAATLQCSVCEHVFRIESSQRVPEQENHRRWMVRTRQRGDILYFTGFDTLHRWIIERRVSLQDEISRTGSRWTKLEQIGEFAPIFQVVESISMLTGGQSAPATAPEPRAPQLNTPQELPKQHTVQQFAQPRQAPQAAPQAPPPRPQPPQQKQPQPQQPQRAAAAPHHATPVPPSPRQGTPAPSPRQTPMAQPQQSYPAQVADEASWSLDQLVPATQLQGDRFGADEDEDEVDADARPPKRRAPLFIFMLLLVGLGVGAFLNRAQLVAMMEAKTPSTPMTTPLTTDPVKTALKEDVSAPDAAHAVFVQAYERATASALEAQLLKVEQGAAQAQVKLAISVEKAQADAAQEAAAPDAGDLIKKGDRAFSRDKYDQARTFYHKALELESRNASAITGLGWSLFMMGKTDAAIAQFQRAIHLNEGHEEAYIGLGKAERSRGRLKQALDAYEDYLSRFPSGKKASIAKYQRDQLKQALGQ